jgi:ferredoxin--NADP+ reductase
MNKIVFKQDLAPQIKKIVVEAPLVAEKVLPGQFVVIIIGEKGERVPLTVAERDKKKGTVTIIFQEIGKTTYELGKLEVGDSLAGFLGPLGRPTEIEKLDMVVTVGGGVGIAEVYPVTRAFKEAGSKVISIIGARSKEQVILEGPMRKVSDELFITTDDGSYQRKGFVSDVLKEVLSRAKVDIVYAVGPLPMMRVVSEITRAEKIKTRVSLNPVMVDATGMCGSCRVTVGGETKFGCVDGPEFDGHLVDYAELEKRLSQFLQQEKRAMETVER